MIGRGYHNRNTDVDHYLVYFHVFVLTSDLPEHSSASEQCDAQRDENDVLTGSAGNNLSHTGGDEA
jgi:hypothetical protein